MRRALCACLLAALLLQTACGGENSAGEGGKYRLYFLAQTESGPALETESWSPEDGGEAEPEQLLQALLAGPASENLASPFPRGTTLLSCGWDDETEGNLLIRLSEQYSGLTDVSLTLADYAIVLTLGQLESVKSVQISATGLPADYRSHQLLVPEEAELETLPIPSGSG